jgi:hypothetical protein
MNPPLLWLSYLFFEMCIFIGDLDRMTLLGNVHILCIIALEFRLNFLIISFRDFENWHKGFRTV